MTGVISVQYRALWGAGAYFEFSGHLVSLRNCGYNYNHALRPLMHVLVDTRMWISSWGTFIIVYCKHHFYVLYPVTHSSIATLIAAKAIAGSLTGGDKTLPHTSQLGRQYLHLYTVCSNVHVHVHVPSVSLAYIIRICLTPCGCYSFAQSQHWPHDNQQDGTAVIVHWCIVVPWMR